jgi:L-asparaginase/Glu-tRNA(Gln) amidotransferase subunit D
VAFYRSSTKRHTANSEFDVSRLTQLPKVAVVYSYVEPEPAVIKAVVTAGAKGIVFAGTGNGALATAERDAIAEINRMPAASRPILVRSSRVGNGRVTATAQFDELGVIPADTLNPQKARILLMLALTRTADPKEVRRIFSEY